MGSSTFNSTYFQPTNIRHKYVCPGSSRYSRRRRHRVFADEKEKDGNAIANTLSPQRRCPPLKVKMSISLFHLLFGLLIFLSILPAVGCMPSPSFVEPEVGWFARALTSVVAAVVGASIAGEPSAAEGGALHYTIPWALVPCRGRSWRPMKWHAWTIVLFCGLIWYSGLVDNKHRLKKGLARARMK